MACLLSLSLGLWREIGYICRKLCYHVYKNMTIAPNRKAAIAPLWSREEGFDWQKIPAVVLSAGSAIESAGSRQEIVDHVALIIKDLVGLTYGVMGATIDEPAIRALGLLSAQVDLAFTRILLREQSPAREVLPRHAPASRFDPGALVGNGPAMKAVYRLVEIGRAHV